MGGLGPLCNTQQRQVSFDNMEVCVLGCRLGSLPRLYFQVGQFFGCFRDLLSFLMEFIEHAA